ASRPAKHLVLRASIDPSPFSLRTPSDCGTQLYTVAYNAVKRSTIAVGPSAILEVDDRRPEMPMNVIELPDAGSRAEQLYAYLRRAIQEGELRPNERLVEAAIAELAGVSRTPVREALHKLQVDGLVA